MIPKPDDQVQQLSALSSPEGRELLARLATADEPSVLRLTDELRRHYPPELVRTAMSQHELRRAAQTKFARAVEMFFTRSGLEQASSEMIARYRAKRYVGRRALADLCCGIGGDLIALADGHEVLAVDRDRLHVAIAVHNAHVYGVGANVSTREADVREVDLSGVEAVFIDPSRRGGSRRLRPGVSEPPLAWCVGLVAVVPAIGIKAAPGIPRAAIPEGWEAEFIADGRDLKEAVLWSPALAAQSRRATILPSGDTLVPVLGPEVAVAKPGPFLLDPNPAITRAGLVSDLARRLGCWKIDQKIGFLSSDTAIRTPFARTLRVVESAPWNEKQFARRLRSLDIGAADIRRRGLAGDVEQIHRRLRLQGHRRATVVITRVRERPWGLICAEVDEPFPVPADLQRATDPRDASDGRG